MEQLTHSLVEQWAEELLGKCNLALTPEERKEQLKYATLIKNPNDKIFLSKLLDESSQIRNRKKLAERVKLLIQQYGVPEFFSPSDRLLLNAYKWLGYKVDFISIPIFKSRLRSDTAAVIINEARPNLTKHLEKRKQQGIGQNVNLLGEVVVGDGEASNRYNHYMGALKEPDINYISIKLSGIYAQLHPLNYQESRSELKELLTKIFQKAIDNPYVNKDGVKQPKFINLDMEEYKDIYLTMELFIEVLSKPQFKDLPAGVVIQAYLPDAYNLQTKLLEFAHKRVAEGGAPLKMRLVKGANIEMESVLSSIRGWKNPILSSKTDVDANFMRILDRALESDNARVVHVGVASHNLFSIGYAYLLSEANGVKDCVSFEMLEGMANQLWRVLHSYGSEIVLYTPVVKNEHFLNAISYLVRRMDENTGPENFLSYSFNLEPNTEEWYFLRDQFREAFQKKETIKDSPNRTQNRGAENHTKKLERFTNEPDTDFYIQSNRKWAEAIVQKWSNRTTEIIPLQIGAEQVVTEKRIRYEDRCKPGYVPYEMSVANNEQIEQMLQVADNSNWSKTTIEERTEILSQVASRVAEHRGDLIGSMATVTSKTFNEADVEISEAIDFARFYPQTMRDTLNEKGVTITPKGTVLVISPWNFPCAIPLGGVAAALSAGNSVILKPATVAAPVMWEVCKLMWEAGVPKDALQIVITDGREPLSKLTSSPIIKHIIMTGGTDTAQHLATNNPSKPLSAETGGKNAMILTSKGDRDKTIMNAVVAAFGNAGQKCSACSLLLVQKDVFQDPSFKEKLKDATESMHTGSPWEFRNIVGPMITNKNEKLQHVLKNREAGTEWLIEPKFLDKDQYILRPTILWGVKPEHYAFHTELFAPLLAVASIDSLEEGIRIINDLDFGLTSGIQTLDEREVALWRDSIEAGNLYINRGITGAIVNRQPFGGTKLSAFGGGIKAGGVNYTSTLVTITDNGTMKEDNYDEIYESEFRRARDIYNLYGEQNVFRYLPLKRMALRVFTDDKLEDIKLIVRAANIAGTPFVISIAEDNPLADKLGNLDCKVEQESLEKFIRNIDKFERIRTCKADLPMDLYKAAALHNIHIATQEVLCNGRLELLHYLKEQSISYEYHRYGSITEVPAIDY